MLCVSVPCHQWQTILGELCFSIEQKTANIVDSKITRDLTTNHQLFPHLMSWVDWSRDFVRGVPTWPYHRLLEDGAGLPSTSVFRSKQSSSTLFILLFWLSAYVTHQALVDILWLTIFFTTCMYGRWYKSANGFCVSFLSGVVYPWHSAVVISVWHFWWNSPDFFFSFFICWFFCFFFFVIWYVSLYR